MSKDENEHVEQCHLIEGPIESLAQLVLLFVVIAGLWYKRVAENPRRPLNIWSLDVSKQLFSGLAAHLCNMGIATLVAMGEDNKTSACSWYFVVYLVDSILGVTLTFFMHRSVILMVQYRVHTRYNSLTTEEEGERYKSWSDYIADCGDYGNPPSLKAWTPQMIEWVIVTVLARCVCGVIIFLSHDMLLVDIASAIDRLFRGHPHLLLFSVMVMCPVLMNLAQAWIQDNILKWTTKMETGKEADKKEDAEFE